MNHVFVAFLLLTTCGVQAQENFADSSLVSKLHDFRRAYDRERGNQLAVFNGVQHYPYSPTIEGIAYFQADEWKRGSVVFSDILYEDIFMKYDLVTDQLIVTPNYDGGLFMSLFSPRVKEFTFDGNRFVRLTRESTNGELSDGFYQVLSTGKVIAIAKTQKFIEEKVDITGISRWFEIKTRYYLVKDGKYKIIRSKNDLTNLLKEHRREVNQALSNLKLRYRKNAQQNIVAATDAYNQSN
jgi:hypothetical protein